MLVFHQDHSHDLDAVVVAYRCASIHAIVQNLGLATVAFCLDLLVSSPSAPRAVFDGINGGEYDGTAAEVYTMRTSSSRPARKERVLVMQRFADGGYLFPSRSLLGEVACICADV